MEEKRQHPELRARLRHIEESLVRVEHHAKQAHKEIFGSDGRDGLKITVERMATSLSLHLKALTFVAATIGGVIALDFGERITSTQPKDVQATIERQITEIRTQHIEAVQLLRLVVEELRKE